MNVKMIDDQKLSLVGNFSTSSTFLEIFKDLTAFFFFKACSKSSFVGLWDHSLEAGCSLLQRPAPWRLEPPRDEPFPSTAVCMSTFQGAGDSRRRKPGRMENGGNFKLQKNKKPFKNFGGSRGSKGQGSNPNNRFNDGWSPVFFFGNVKRLQFFEEVLHLYTR